MKLNTKKCQVMTFQLNLSPVVHEYNIRSEPLTRVLQLQAVGYWVLRLIRLPS
ncbi:hypothetical protein J6590_028961 [Homalodisca vitripennis]|nr:hypothetical protein J6590_028961 [Homalodisca vitripennis]